LNLSFTVLHRQQTASVLVPLAWPA
jgi:hypothetical protein